MGKALVIGLIVFNIVAVGLVSSGLIYLDSQYIALGGRIQRLEDCKWVRQRMERDDLSPKVSRNADTMQNVYTKRMEVTAYTCGPESTGKSPELPEYAVTASGYKINVGVGEKLVAAPSDIPFGTKMYVPGYGLAIVQDRGGASTGDYLDVYFDDIEKAVHWGRKQIEVVIFRL